VKEFPSNVDGVFVSLEHLLVADYARLLQLHPSHPSAHLIMGHLVLSLVLIAVIRTGQVGHP
jgi:hypothetical protein